MARMDELLSEYGNERHIGQRVQDERKRHGWSQAQLARRMGAAGHPMHQSAISKIEPDDPEQRAGRRRGEGRATQRRSVTVGEALALANVLEVPLGELLLPKSILERARAVRALSEGQSACAALLGVQHRYHETLNRIAESLMTDPEFRAIVDDLTPDVFAEDNLSHRFLDDVRNAYERLTASAESAK